MKKIKSFIFFIILFLLYPSCNSSTEMKKRLTEGKTFWDVYDIDRKYISGSYCFKADGSWCYYTNKNGHRERLPEGDVVYSHKWSLKGDTVLILDDIKMIISKSENDTIILLNEKSHIFTTLVKGEN